MMTLRHMGLVAIVLLAPVSADAQVSQPKLSQQLVHANRDERNRAFEMARVIGVQEIGTELRAALIIGLQHEGDLHAKRRRGDIGFFENPELIAGLAHLVAQFRDARSIPALAGSLGTSPPAVLALAEFGEPAAQPVLDVVISTDDASAVMDALTSLRLMVEGVGARPLAAKTLSDIRRVAEQRLTGKQSVTTLWRAIDLAVVLNDPDLRRAVESLASDGNAVVAKGVSDPELIKLTQELAAERLAGIPPLPRR